MTRRRWWLLGGAVVLVWMLVAGFLLVRAATDLREGRDAARVARELLDVDAIADGRALPDLRRAHDRFESAGRAVDNPVLTPLRLLPVIGRQLRSVRALADAAGEVSDATLVALSRAHEVLRDPRSGAGARLRQVRRLSDALESANRRVRSVHDLGPRSGLIRPLADAHNELAAKLVDARTTLANASAGAVAGRRLLEGPRQYLVVAANSAEMRAGSGMWLSGAVLRTEAGHLELEEMRPLYEQAAPPRGAVPVTDKDLADRWEELWHPNWDWRGLMTSPRMPVAAELGRRMWLAARGEPIDGVLVVDARSLAAVVRATGPVTVGGRELDADDVEAFILNEQYRSFEAQPGQADRRDALGAIAGSAFDALDRGRWSPTVLARELTAAVRGRHVLAWSADEVEQRGWEAAGLNGDLTADSLFVSVLNRGGNKLDYFLHASGEISRRSRGRHTEVTVRVQLWNAIPVDQPSYVLGPPSGFRWAPGTYLGVVAVNVPGTATEVRVTGDDAPPVLGPDGVTTVVATEINLPSGGVGTVEVSFLLPGRRGRLVVESSGRVPAVRWRFGGRTWQDFAPRTVNW